jgi:signal transduction histidine kinase
LCCILSVQENDYFTNFTGLTFEIFVLLAVPRHNGGMGLGLAIAKEFVEDHQGSIAIQSKVGQGATFIVYLPIFK